MGREARVSKNRTCRVCEKTFVNLTPAQIQMHAVACSFEQATGIEIIRMGPTEVEATSGREESLIITP